MRIIHVLDEMRYMLVIREYSVDVTQYENIVFVLFVR